MNLYIGAVVIQLLLFIYFEMITLINLFPWNDLSPYSTKEKVIEGTANGVIILLGMILFITKIKWLMIGSVLLWFVFLLMQLITWWMPYLTGKHLNQFPRSLYDSHFQKTIKVLPPIKNHIIPDVQHNVLQFISLVCLVVSAMAVIEIG